MIDYLKIRLLLILCLSSFIEEKGFDVIDFVKMDIEGSKKEVIKEISDNNK